MKTHFTNIVEGKELRCDLSAEISVRNSRCNMGHKIQYERSNCNSARQSTFMKEAAVDQRVGKKSTVDEKEGDTQ